MPLRGGPGPLAPVGGPGRVHTAPSAGAGRKLEGTELVKLRLNWARDPEATPRAGPPAAHGAPGTQGKGSAGGGAPGTGHGAAKHHLAENVWVCFSEANEALVCVNTHTFRRVFGKSGHRSITL